MIFTKCYYPWYKINKHIKHYLNDVKCFYQRGTKGYCYRDLCDIDTWFLSIMSKMLNEFKNKKHGYPILDSKLSYEENEKKYNNILDEMINCFIEANEYTCTRENQYEDTYKTEVKFKKTDNNFTEVEFIHSDKKQHNLYMKEERKIQRYREHMKNRGLYLFKKYLYTLWY